MGEKGILQMSVMIYKSGLPYGPDIRRLDEAFPVSSLTEGRVIKHEELEAVLELKRTSSRYYAVVRSWISHCRNSDNIFLVWEPRVGLKVLPPAEVLDHAETKTRQKIRQTARAIRLFGWVDRGRLDEVGQRRLDHQLRVAGAIKDSLDAAKKQLAVELAPAKSLPKRKVGDDA